MAPIFHRDSKRMATDFKMERSITKPDDPSRVLAEMQEDISSSLS